MLDRQVGVDCAVHYYAEGSPHSGPYDATVAAVAEDGKTVDLQVRSPTATRLKQAVPFSTSPLKHHWVWPPAR